MYKNKDILKPFIENPQRKFHIREIARLVNTSPMTARKGLNVLVKKGVLIKRKTKIYDEFKPNFDSIEFQMLSKVYIIKKVFGCGLIDYLENELLPEAIYLFGSYAKGDYTSKSDIDLFILSNEKKEINVLKYEKKLGKKLQLHILTSNEFKIAKKKNPELINNMINGVKIRGYLEVV